MKFSYGYYVLSIAKDVMSDVYSAKQCDLDNIVALVSFAYISIPMKIGTFLVTKRQIQIKYYQIISEIIST